jgi:hypothetical protein
LEDKRGEDSNKMVLGDKLQYVEVGGTSSGLYPILGFGICIVEPFGFATGVLDYKYLI